MLLGDLLARFDDDSIAAETVLALDDLALIARLREQAATDGMTLGAYAAVAVRRYAAEASDQEWVTLMGALGRAADPGRVCMQRAFAYVLDGSC
ncbi:MAG TPA: hypothetical protein VL048_10885 [Xanthobacteraceae bacterium]|jgi:hypothetical protein|nr:hypothetical protein [Xanthobacteraceae bacterium]